MKNSHLRKLNNMRKRPIKLKESDIMNIVKRVIRERENIPYPIPDTPGPPQSGGSPDRGPKRPGPESISQPNVDREKFDEIVIRELVNSGFSDEEVAKIHPIFWFIFLKILMTPGVLHESRRTNKRPIRRNRRR